MHAWWMPGVGLAVPDSFLINVPDPLLDNVLLLHFSGGKARPLATWSMITVTRSKSV